MLRRRTLALAFAAMLGLPLAVGGCASPTLPLPPPYAPSTVEIGEGGMVTLSGGGLPNALVYVLNQDAEQGVIVKSSSGGAFEVKLAASVGHTLALWQEAGIERSPSILVSVVPAKKK